MKVYRLESLITGGGPFTDGGPKTPTLWRHTHEPPQMDRSESGSIFRAWRKKYKYRNYYTQLPQRFRFSCCSIEALEDCFPNFRNYSHLVLKEYTLDAKAKKDFCILPDGQVIFSTKIVVSSTVL